MSKKDYSNPGKNSFEKSGVDIFQKHTKKFLIVFGIIGFLIRWFYFPYDIPIALDGLNYFLYALELSFEQQFPNGFHVANNGWPTFVSFFFSIFQSDNFFNYVYIQRILSLSISVLTVIPVYLLCTRFVNRSFALIGASIFVFEPRIIQNSLLGLTEPLYILLGVLGLFFFLSEKTKLVYLSFGIFALFSLVRFEGLIIIFPISIMFFIKYKKDRKVILRYLLAISIFILVLTPMAYIRIETTEQDGLISHVFGIGFISNQIIDGKPNAEGFYPGNDIHERFFNFITTGLKNLVMYLGWVLIPVFIFFIPFGIFKMFKKKNVNEITIILVTITILFPAFYAYGREIQETRFLYVIFPILCIVSTFTVQKIAEKVKNHNYLLIVFLIGILFSSLIFLDYKKIDYENEREAYSIARFVVSNTDGINNAPGVKYIRPSEVQEKWPDLPSYNIKGRPTYDLKIFSTEKYDDIEKFIDDNREKNLTHLIIDRATDQSFLYSVLDNEKEYPYLIRIFDSSDYNYNSWINIYKINYEKFDLRT